MPIKAPPQAVYTHAARTTIADDELGLEPFIERLVKPVLEWPTDSSLVIGLYGEWGHGKTTALYFLEEWLRQHEGVGKYRAVVIQFQPWLYSSPEALYRSFFATLTSKIRKTPVIPPAAKRTLARSLEGLATVLPLIDLVPGLPIGKAGAGALGKLAKGLRSTIGLDEASFEERRSKVRKQLEALGKGSVKRRLVVLIDDLDRAEYDMVLATMKLVKLIADLPNVSYVVAMDHARVRHVLGKEYGDEYAATYLEKIVQVTVHLPPISPERLAELVRASVRDIFKQAGADAERVLVESDFGPDLFDKTLGHRVRTLRDRARLADALRFMVLSGSNSLDIHAEDALLVTFLQVFFPDVYDEMRRSRDLLTGTPSYDEIFLGGGERRQKAQARRNRRYAAVVNAGLGQAHRQTRGSDPEQEPENDALAGLEADSSRVVESCLKILFPHARRINRPDESTLADLRRHNRVASPDHFDKYFRLEAPPDEIEDARVQAGLALLAVELTKSDAEAVQGVEEVLRSLFARCPALKRDSLKRKLNDRWRELDWQRVALLVRGLLRLEDVFGHDGAHSAAVEAGRCAVLNAHAAHTIEEDRYDAGEVGREVAYAILESSTSVDECILRTAAMCDRGGRELWIQSDEHAAAVAQRGLAHLGGMTAAFQALDRHSEEWFWRVLSLYSVVQKAGDDTVRLRALVADAIRDEVLLFRLVRFYSDTGVRSRRWVFGARGDYPNLIRALDLIVGRQALREACEMALRNGAPEEHADLYRLCVTFLQQHDAVPVEAEGTPSALESLAESAPADDEVEKEAGSEGEGER